MTEKEKMQMFKDDNYLLAKEVKKLKEEKRELQRQLKIANDKYYELLRSYNFIKSAYNKMKGE